MSQQYPPPPAGAADAPPLRARPRMLRWALASAAIGALMIYNSVDSAGRGLPAPPASAAAPPSAGTNGQSAIAPVPTVAVPPLPASAPTRLVVKGIGVNAPFTALHLDPSGNLGAPPAGEKNLVGWYADGPSPGERGPAIVAGHVDTKTGPAVFLMLRLVRPGDPVEITRADGTVAVFTVDSVEQFSKGDFPDRRVYGDTPDPQLRLITCGGSYDRSKRDYTDNVVVFAHLTSSRRA
ncbi:class F sortase [Streptomyces sp. NPDC020983]|uniref:class F sortase n=1 Tax=Streptomyces sp. NPDC020983 TaxID=3365106 RepID=UPI00378B403D